MASKPLKPPDAFLSYTRFDDKHDGRAISKFRLRLSSAVHAITGEPFEIFQDVDGIGLGEHWPGKLDRMLDEVRFFIPILTPSYFRSKVCREELERFLIAERAKGRVDLVLPIYYIDCAILEDEELRSTDPLAVEMHDRHHYDWRKLRLRSLSTMAVKTAFQDLAQAIDQIRRRTPPRMSTLPPRPETRPSGTVFRDIDATWCPELVVIPPGEFLMGSTEGERQWAVEHGAKPEWVEPEKPQHLVRIAYSLAVGRYPVTFEEYDHFARSRRRAHPPDGGWGRGRRPVINVDWEDARALAAWLSAQTGQRYRLLSEAEWEYACRAGTTTRFWWGDQITPTNANYGGNVGKPDEVGRYPANPFRLRDMHGNVWEWVEDRWHGSYDGAPDDGSAWFAGNDSRRVMRGGSWDKDPGLLRSAIRAGFDIGFRYFNLGVRVARTLTP